MVPLIVAESSGIGFAVAATPQSGSANNKASAAVEGISFVLCNAGLFVRKLWVFYPDRALKSIGRNGNREGPEWRSARCARPLRGGQFGTVNARFWPVCCPLNLRLQHAHFRL